MFPPYGKGALSASHRKMGLVCRYHDGNPDVILHISQNETYPNIKYDMRNNISPPRNVRSRDEHKNYR
jgi:hypothetical protein